MKAKEVDKRMIKRERIKGFFLDAAKKIITNEGVEKVTIRKVAESAGYSYATIYNYFTDLNELLWETKSMMVLDLIEIVKSRIDIAKYDVEGIKNIFKIYISYYFDNPNIFRFFYLYQLIKPENKHGTAVEEPNYDEIWADTFKEFINKRIISIEDLEVIAKIFIYSMHGMMTLSFSYNMELTEENVYRDIEIIVDYLLKKN
ncbi:conserved protein of unknown function [Petrocella atlantisensis]|uniref:HTH tetR-type domain-containing protein n=1 Tax=Petrocella atlantisensis TaxID=2173034 RepID=A0A3P7RTH0_9FIRM|nr:TetR/AcrR family transcriptional regulator [Petrocella atlantisensis]VDN46196.1 conserved protein of unknown function [Petrocella atlantisensis]